ncbi:MAG TPA: cobalt ABC transporter ATP-binding protein, partial [Ruminococcaceae bacterium]|nr:cobalt ABC transporter ATP-binding protein [Oscillospiraceae bacterium]
MKAVRFVNYTFCYPNAGTPALKGINLSVNSGEYLLICGKTGTGKSTLLRSIKAELAPVGKKTGEVLIFSAPRDGSRNRANVMKVGFVAQDPDSQTVMDTVESELAFGLQNMGLPANVIRRRMAEIAGFFGIGGWISKKIHTLSSGQKQILNLACVTAMQPEILLLDEPTARLDPIASAEFLQAVGRINKELGKTVLISEHRLGRVLPEADRVVYLSGGTAETYASPIEFVRRLYGGEDGFKAALPAPVRVAYKLGERLDYPLGIKQGRQWLAARAPICAVPDSEPENPYEKPLIAAKSVWFRYDKNEDFVLKNISFAARAGEVHAIVGGNGSGKTTFLRLLCGALKPNRGKISKSADMRCGLLSGEPKALLAADTVAGELSEWQKEYGYGDRDIQKIMDELGISHLTDRHPYDLSGGEMQKTALAKILLLRPGILLLDEPVKGMDAEAKAELLVILRRLVKEGKSIVLVTHDLEFAASVADRCSMLFGGGIACTDTMRCFFSSNLFYTT